MDPVRGRRRGRRRPAPPGLGTGRPAGPAAGSGVDRVAPSRPGSARSRSGCGNRCSGRDDGPALMTVTAFDVCGPLPTAPPCWRPAPAPARPSRSRRSSTRYVAEGVAPLDELLRRHLRPGGQPGAARAGARTAGRAPSAALADPTRHARGRRSAARRCWPTRDAPRSAAAPPPARDGAGRLRRRHDRDHPPVLPAGAAGLGVPATPTPARGSSRTSTTWSPRWSTTSTCASTRRRDADVPAVQPGRGRAGDRRRGRRRPPGPAGAGRRDAGDDRPGRGSASPRRSATRSSGASGAGGSSASTTCSAGCTPR